MAAEVIGQVADQVVQTMEILARTGSGRRNPHHPRVAQRSCHLQLRVLQGLDARTEHRPFRASVKKEDVF